MPTKDVNKLLKGATDVVLAAVDDTGAASPAQVGDTFPLLNLDFVDEESIQSDDKKLTMQEAGGGTLQLGQLTSLSVKTMSELTSAPRRFKNARCNVYGFGSQQSHRIDKMLMNVEFPQDFKKDGKSLIVFSSERKVSPDELLGSIGQTPAAFATDAAYRYNQFVNRVSQDNLALAFIAHLGNFGQAAKAYDASENRLVATLANGPAWGTAPDGIGSKLTFDGVNDYLDFGDVMDDDGVSDLLIEVWVKILAANGTKVNVLAKKNALQNTTVGYGIVRDTSNAIYFDFADGTNRVTFGSGGNAVMQNVWNHVAVAIDRNGNGQMYLNGVAVGTPTSVASVGNAANALSLFIGRDGAGSYSNFEFAGNRLYNYGANGLPSNIAIIVANNYAAEKAILGL